MVKTCCQTHQVESVSFDPVPPATVGLLSFLSANQHVSLPCHQTLQDNRKQIYLASYIMHNHIVLSVCFEAGLSLHTKAFHVCI